MSPHAAKYPRWSDALATCRAALQQGYLTKAGKQWIFGHRRFAPITVNRLIDNGEAIRIGDHVVKWRAA